ncbi:MAG: AIPR family protein [Betaproteobacteria bacterium]|nr:AIPR family protein [Betaproteobacteria bacterium]
MAHKTSDPITFQALEDLLTGFTVQGRTESASFLIWFLETVFRLDSVEATDAICDRKHDEGFDGIAINEELEEIVVFQAKRAQKAKSALGDTDLKMFIGSLKHLESEATAEHLFKTTKNPELQSMLVALRIAERIKQGYKVKPIFVTNLTRNSDAEKYIEQLEKASSPIDVWDLDRLRPLIEQLAGEWFVSEKAKLNITDGKYFFTGKKTKPDVVCAAVPAAELVTLPGIADTRIFAQNVRLWLGNTRVNKQLSETIAQKREHKGFLTFHNGLTVVVREMKIYGTRIFLEGFSVCNGCQSLMAFFQERAKLTGDLEVLVRFVRVEKDRKVQEKIAYRTNNQNPISLRDLSANDAKQIQIQEEFNYLYGHAAHYSIKRGEAVERLELFNEDVGRLLLAIYNKEPWSCHQKYKILGEYRDRIFSYYTNAHAARMCQLIANVVKSQRAGMKIQRIAGYGLTVYVVSFLLAEILRTSPKGRDVLENPEKYLYKKDSANPLEAKLIKAFTQLVKTTIVNFNYVIDQSGGEGYDYKSKFKSQIEVMKIRDDVLKDYEKDVTRGKEKAFSI